jgi:hypothetical protein
MAKGSEVGRFDDEALPQSRSQVLDLGGGNAPDEMSNYLVKSVTLSWICVFERQRTATFTTSIS